MRRPVIEDALPLSLGRLISRGPAMRGEVRHAMAEVAAGLLQLKEAEEAKEEREGPVRWVGDVIDPAEAVRGTDLRHPAFAAAYKAARGTAAKAAPAKVAAMPEDYHRAFNAALDEVAGGDIDGRSWPAFFLKALRTQGLALRVAAPITAADPRRYPGGWPYTAPRPPPNARWGWPEEAQIVWSGEDEVGIPAAGGTIRAGIGVASEYLAAMSGALAFAGIRDDGWHRRYVIGLRSHGLALWEAPVVRDDARYPNGWPSVAPLGPWAAHARVIWANDALRGSGTVQFGNGGTGVGTQPKSRSITVSNNVQQAIDVTTTKDAVRRQITVGDILRLP